MSVRFSVIIPTRHRNDLLAKCLDCLAPGVQTLSADQYEVIVTDDGSKSTAEQMLRERYPWARWIAGPQRGPASNRNNGAQRAVGDYIAFTDDDCLPERGWLEAFDNSLSSDVSVYEGKTVCRDGIRSPLETAPCNETGGYLWSCNMAVEKSLFSQMGGFDEVFPYPAMEDVDFRERLREDGHPFVFAAEAVVDHPPRRLDSGVCRGAMWESRIYYYIKSGKYTGDIRWFVVRMLLNYQIRAIMKSKIQRGTLQYVCVIVTESLYCLFNVNRWSKKHKHVSERNGIKKTSPV